MYSLLILTLSYSSKKYKAAKSVDKGLIKKNQNPFKFQELNSLTIT